MSDGRDGASIVVGLDGSEAGKDALRWAVRQAGLADAELRAIAVWRRPLGYGIPADYSDVDFEARVRRELDETLGEVVGAEWTTKITAEVVEGHAGPVLVDRARGAGLLVVGSHGRGAFTGMLLGSVSQYCVQHAACPVVVVRHPGPRG